MKKLLIILGLIMGSTSGSIAAPSWRELQAAVEANDFVRLETWVKQEGVQSSTALHALIAASQSGNRTVADRLLALGISLNRATEYGVTPLLKAAENGCTEMVNH